MSCLKTERDPLGSPTMFVLQLQLTAIHDQALIGPDNCETDTSVLDPNGADIAFF